MSDPTPTESEALERADLETSLTSEAAIEALSTAIRRAAYQLTPDDYEVIATAEELVVDGPDVYKQGWELVNSLDEIGKTIDGAHERFKIPLAALTKVVREIDAAAKRPLAGAREPLRKRLGEWHIAQEARDRAATEARQRGQDEAARAAQDARATTLARLADAEGDPRVAESYRREAAAVAGVTVHAAPVEEVRTVPSGAEAGGYVKKQWKCKFVDVRALVAAWLDGKCLLDEDAIAAGLQASLDKQADALQHNLSKAYPGTEAIQVPIPTRARRR